MKTHKVILVEDDVDVSLMLSRQLQRGGYVVAVAGSLADARELVREPWDLAILDRHLPDGDGIELCCELREAVPHAYIVMLTGEASEQAKLDGFACGADDYVTKPAPIGELMARIRAGLRIVELQKALMATNRQLAELSQTDPLTSLRNRRAFDERLADAFDQAARYGRPLSLVLVDLDHFKNVNDTHGHDAGDDTLRGVSRVIAGVTRQSDFVARVGGEEFAVILPETALFEALQFGEKLRATVATANIGEHRVTVSVGIANVPHSEIATTAELFRAADQALYRAKVRGRNRVEIERRRTLRESGSNPVATSQMARA